MSTIIFISALFDYLYYLRLFLSGLYLIRYSPAVLPVYFYESNLNNHHLHWLAPPLKQRPSLVIMADCTKLSMGCAFLLLPFAIFIISYLISGFGRKCSQLPVSWQQESTDSCSLLG